MSAMTDTITDGARWPRREGNKLALRLACVRNPDLSNVRTVGPQHATFDDTLPRGR